MTGQRAFWVGLAVSAGLLAAFAYLFLPVDDIGEAFASANFVYVVPSLAFYFLAVYARTVRWRYILHPLIGRPRRALYPVVVVGYMANNVLPVRLGEVVRAYYTSLREPVSPAAAFGTVAVERAADVVALLLIAAGVLVVLPTSGLLDNLAADVPGGVPILITLSTVLLLVIIGVLAVAIFASESTVLNVVEQLLAPLPARIRGRLLAMSANLIEGLKVLRSPKALVAVIVLSLPVWLLEAGMILVIALGFDVFDALDSTSELIAVVLLFTATVNLSGVVPAFAGGIGSFEFIGAATLASIGISGVDAGLYVLTVHVALLLPVTVLGGVMLYMDGTSFRKLVGRARATKPPRVESAAEPSP